MPQPSKSSDSRLTLGGNTNRSHGGKGKGRAVQVPPCPHPPLLTRSGLTPQLTLIYRDMTRQPSLQPPTATPRHLPKNTPIPGRQISSTKGSTPELNIEPGHLDPSWRPPPTWAPKAATTYAQAITPSAKGKKGRWANPPALASSVGVEPGKVFTKPPPPLPVRRESISKNCEITQADNLYHRRRLSRKAQCPK